MADYDTLLEKLHDDYGPRALALLEKIAEVCKAEGFTVASEPADMQCDDYRWSMGLQRPETNDTDNMVGITVEIAEERQYEGGEGWGVTFRLDIVEYGGRILGGLAPYNYTDLCWVDARSAARVETRWSIIEQADLSTIPELIGEQ